MTRSRSLKIQRKPWETLSKEDKILIEDLVLLEHFGVRDKLKNEGYVCVQNCDICNNSVNLSHDSMSSLNNSELLNEDWSEEKRKTIIKQLVHEFFEAKWKTQQDEINKLVSQKPANKYPDGSTTSLTHELTLKKNYLRILNRKSITMYKEKLRSGDSICKIIRRKDHLMTNIHSFKPNDYAREKRFRGHELVRHHKFREDSGNSGKTKLTIREQVLRIHNFESDIFNFETAKRKSANSESHNHSRGQDQAKKSPPVYQTPMDDLDGPFFVDKEIVNRDMYQEGLAVKKWNPTQVLYELCSMCQWGVPEFTLMSYTPYKSFLFSVRIKDHTFIAAQEGKTKKAAKHLASTKFLQFLGFKFESKPKQAVQEDRNRSSETGRFLDLFENPFSRALETNVGSVREEN